MSIDNTSPTSNAQMEVINGDYHKLATFLGKRSNVNIFRKFGSLNALNLLYYQAELAQLEERLHNLYRRDRTSYESGAEKTGMHCWASVASESLDAETKSNQSDRVELILKSRMMLEKYNAALASYNTVSRLSKPTATDLEAFRCYLFGKDGCDGFISWTEGKGYHSDERILERDLVTTCDKHSERELFGAFIADHCTKYFERLFGRCYTHREEDVEGGLVHFDDRKLNRAAYLIGTLIASLLPAMSIFVLYTLKHTLARLGTIMAFSAIFSFSLAIFTKARPVEIFAATAAFASVQVVFVGTTTSSP